MRFKDDLKSSKILAYFSSQKASSSPVPPAKKSKSNERRTPGESFRRVDTELWSQEIVQGLEDNSCQLLSEYPVYLNLLCLTNYCMRCR